MTKLDGEEIVAAIEQIHAAFPTEPFCFRVEVSAAGSVDFMFKVGLSDGYAEYSAGLTVAGAMDKMLAKAPDRNPEAIRQRKVERLTKELAELGVTT